MPPWSCRPTGAPAFSTTRAPATNHSAPSVVHRDLKPANLIVSESGIKLLDFGIAKLHAAEPEFHAGGGGGVTLMTHAGQLPGTAAYMSPEQLTGAGVDGRTDLFALGAVLYEMATGRRAFPGDAAAVVKSAILEAGQCRRTP